MENSEFSAPEDFDIEEEYEEFFSGYKNWTDEPISFMVPMSNPIFQKGLKGRDRLMAFMPPNPSEIGLEEQFDDPKWLHHPVANQINHHVDLERLEEIEESSDFPRHVVYVSSWKGFDKEILEHLDDSDFFTMMNPREMRPNLYNKQLFHGFGVERDLPILPSVDFGDAYNEDREWLEDKLGRTDELVLKKKIGGRGNQVQKISYEEIDELVDEDLEATETTHIIQPFVDHYTDKRLKLIDGVVAAENRYGDPEDFRCNLSLVGTDKDLEAFRALKVFAYDLGEPLSIEDSDKHSVLEEEAREIGEELYNELVEEFADDSLPEPNVIASADIMETKESDIDFLPDEYRERIPVDNDGNAYVLNEANNGSGSILDRLCHWEGMYENIPSIHLAVKLRDIAGYETMEPAQHAGNYHSRIWNRVASNYLEPQEVRERIREYSEDDVLNSEKIDWQ